MNAPLPHIRNFALIAHIDHGKSTLADRLIETCGALSAREMRAQVLDSMDIERERGITIKAQTVRLTHKTPDGRALTLNMIDTPGHADFGYEVSRSLAACEGAVLLVDAAQGVEAQSLATVYQALEADLEILPVLNKIDLPAADPDGVRAQITQMIGLDAESALEISAKTGAGVDAFLAALVERLPPPKGAPEEPLKALVIDSWFDPYLGIVVLTRMIDGTLRKGARIEMMASGGRYAVERVGVFLPTKESVEELTPGEIGYFTAAIRQTSDARIGDTIRDADAASVVALPGFRPARAVVFCGMFPEDTGRFPDLREAMAKLQLNDAGFSHEPEQSAALGPGFRCGFLGLLHLEIIEERLLREFDLPLITSAPSVVYHVHMTDGTQREVHSPADMPDPTHIARIEEPWIRATILMPDTHLGAVLALCEERRGRQHTLTYSGARAMVMYDLPLNEVIFDFHDRLKSASRGYASFDWQFLAYEDADVVRLSVLLDEKPVDALALIVHRSRAETRGRAICAALKEKIPRHLFKIPIQAAIGGRIIARETVPAMRKDVTAKCYGGDVSRKRKLLDKQKKGKKRMRRFGSVSLPQDVLLAALKAQKD